jgi:hypothetical protein
MKTWFERPSSLGLLGAFFQFSFAGSVSYCVWITDPLFESKIHGPLLAGLASASLMQDAFMGKFQKAKEDARQLDGLKSTHLTEHFEKLARLSEYAERTWLMATFLRGLLVVAGLLLAFGTFGWNIRAVAVLGGYAASAFALVLCIRTYRLHRHVETFVVNKDNEQRLAVARTDSAERLRMSVESDWDRNLNPDGYEKIGLRLKK